jgi:hypothetical protein
VSGGLCDSCVSPSDRVRSEKTLRPLNAVLGSTVLHRIIRRSRPYGPRRQFLIGSIGPYHGSPSTPIRLLPCSAFGNYLRFHRSIGMHVIRIMDHFSPARRIAPTDPKGVQSADRTILLPKPAASRRLASVGPTEPVSRTGLGKPTVRRFLMAAIRADRTEREERPRRSKPTGPAQTRRSA